MASSGAAAHAHTRPRPRAPARGAITSHGLRALQSMMRPSAPRFAVRSFPLLQRRLSRLSAAIRKLPEVTTTSPGVETREHLDAIVRLDAELDLLWLEPPFAEVDGTRSCASPVWSTADSGTISALAALDLEARRRRTCRA